LYSLIAIRYFAISLMRTNRASKSYELSLISVLYFYTVFLPRLGSYRTSNFYLKEVGTKINLHTWFISI